MPTTFQITDGTLTVDLVTNTDWKLAENYLPVFAQPAGDGTIPPDITESIPCHIAAVDDDDLASSLADLAQLARYAAEYTAGNHQTPVWMNRTMQDETNGTRTLVQSIRFTSDARYGGLFDRPPCVEGGRRAGVLTVTHHPYLERTSAVAASGTNGVSVLGGAVNYTDVAGDVGARMYYLNIDNLTGALYRRYWIGFRSDRRAGGNAGNVVTLWEFEDGTPGTDSALAGDVTASPGGGGNTKVQCNFAVDIGWNDRGTIKMSDVTANYGNQVGAYVVLLRAKVANAANPAQVKLRQTSNTLSVYREGPTVEIAETSWTLYNLGTCEWPGRDLHATPVALFAATYDQRDGLSLYGRQSPSAGGAPTLDMDCLILIPADEYFIQVQTVEQDGSDDSLYVTVAPEDTTSAQNVDNVSSYFNIHCPVSVMGSGIPEGDGRFFVCVATTDAGLAPTFSDTLDAEVSYYPRYVHFRGGD